MNNTVKPRICIINHGGWSGGGTKSMIDLVDMLNGEYEVIGAIPVGAIRFGEQLKNHGATVLYVKTPIPILPKYSGSASTFSSVALKTYFSRRKKNILKFCREIEECRPDLIIFNSIVTCISAPYFNKTIKKICFIRETIVDKKSGSYFKDILEKNIHGVSFLAQKELEKMSLKKPRTIVISDCVPNDDVELVPQNEAKRAENIDVNKNVILYMGGDGDLKGPDVILNAMAKLDEKYLLLLAGSWNSDNYSIKGIFRHCYSPIYIYENLKLQKAFQRNKDKKDNIIMVGYRDNITNLMNAADVIVFPSTKVHQPRPCIEAGFYKKPVIISDFEETKEYFANNYNALTFSPGNAFDLATKIKIVCSDKKFAREMGENNYEMSIKKHNFKLNSILLADFIKNIINE